MATYWGECQTGWNWRRAYESRYFRTTSDEFFASLLNEKLRAVDETHRKNMTRNISFPRPQSCPVLPRKAVANETNEYRATQQPGRYLGGRGDVMVRRLHAPINCASKLHQSGFFMSKSGSVLHP
eukprot:GEMP01097932.1.p1 GENE.GEMP01097932.1~~GEMP01097932.1.p1  ORF type:complete len:125 (+),score=10.77 GEMP01097932.1:311-685(+)